MATDNQHDQAPASGSRTTGPPSLKSLALAHRRACAAAIALLLVVAAVTVVTDTAGSTRQPLSDATTCSQWGAAASAQRVAYSNLYIGEYEAVPDTTAYAQRVETAIDEACVKAAYLGEADDVSVLAALRHAY